MPRTTPSLRETFRFVREHGIVLESGHGPVPTLVDAIVGEEVRGSWWGHPRGQEIFRATRAVRESEDVLVCRLIDGKVTYVHTRLWPALVRLAGTIGRDRLGAIREEHTASGAHRLRTIPFPRWVSPAAQRAAERLSEASARDLIGEWLEPHHMDRKPRAPGRKA